MLPNCFKNRHYLLPSGQSSALSPENQGTSGFWSKASVCFHFLTSRMERWGTETSSNIMKTLPCSRPAACQHIWQAVLTLVESSEKKRQQVRIMYRTSLFTQVAKPDEMSALQVYSVLAWIFPKTVLDMTREYDGK